MKPDAVIAGLSALAQEHRLALFRLLVQAGEDGMAAGRIADALGLPNSSLSFHLAQLQAAGLIEQERQGRSLIYRANYRRDECSSSPTSPKIAAAALRAATLPATSVQERETA